MPSAEKQVRVFISSTFRDMHAERDHLVTVVFPELRERVERLGLDFFDVDLRWGVPAKDANGETANSWEYCRQWIDRVEPFFVCILGQRYGWVPEPEQLKASEDRQRQQDERRSITDMEARHAVLQTKLKRRSYFYLRAKEAPATAGEYVDSPTLLRKLEQLKNEVRSCGRPVRDYPCEWTGSSFTDMEEFGRRVLDDLWSGVLRDERYVSKEVWRHVLGADPDSDARYMDESKPVPEDLAAKIVKLAKPEPQEPLDAEREQMDAFATTRLRWFQGRTRELQQLTDFLESTAPDAPPLAIVAAVPGQGKSALLASLHEQLKSSPHFVITHFVGATELSSSTHALVERLLGELDRSGVVWPTEPQQEGQELSQDFNSLCLRLSQRLGVYAGERRIVILIDGLNQLSDGQDLHWLPAPLGPNVRVVVSCVEDKAAKAESSEQRVLRALGSRQPAPFNVQLRPLTEREVRIIVVEYLKEYCKELDREHADAICRMEQARNPLYLLVMLGELRTLGGNDMNRIMGERIAALALDYPNTVSLFRWVLQRLEVFGPEVVQWWCMYLANGRVGMASKELADLLARKLDANAAPTALLIERGLRRYLLRRGAQFDFFHSQLRQAVMEQYGTHTETAIVHSEIAAYFDQQAWFLRSASSQRVPNQRKCVELLHQHLLAHDPQPVRGLLFSFELNEAKIAAGLLYDLIDEYSRAYSALPKDASDTVLMVLLRQAVQRNAAFLQKSIGHYPQALLQSCYNSLGHLCCQRGTSFVDSTNSPRLRHLLESWRESLASLHPNSYWLRSRIEPLISPGTRLQTVCQAEALTQGDGKVVFSPDGGQVTRVSIGLNIRTFEVYSGKQVSHVEGAGATSTLGKIVISQDVKRIAGTCYDDTLRMWHANTGDQIFCVKLQNSPVMDIAFSPDGSVIAGGTGDGTIRIWGTRTGKELRCLKANSKPVRCVSFSADGSLLVTESDDETIRLWDATKQARQLRCFKLPRDSSMGRRHVHFLPSDDSIIVVSTSYSIMLLDVKTGKTTSYFTEQKVISSFSLAIAADGTRIVHLTHGGFQVIDVRLGKTIFTFRSPFLIGDTIAISPDGRLVATGIFDGIGVWDLDLNAPCQTTKHERYQHGTSDISTWGTSKTRDLKVVSVSSDGSLCIWRYNKPFMDLVRKFTHQTDTDGNKIATFSPDGGLFAVIHSEMRCTLNTVSLYDSITNSLHAKVIEHSDGVHSDVLSGTFFKQFPSVWALCEGSRLDIEDLRRLQECPHTETPHEFAVRDLRGAMERERPKQQEETNKQPLISENGELLIRESASGSVVAYYPCGLSRVQSIPITDSWAASSRAGLEILSLENSSAKLW